MCLSTTLRANDLTFPDSCSIMVLVAPGHRPQKGLSDRMAEQVKIGEKHYEVLSRYARRIGMSRAEMCRRSIDLYTTVIKQPSFWRVVQKLNGRRLADVIVALLGLWVEGEIVLEGDPK